MGIPPRIVLTGGPGGGKTTLLRELREEDPRRERYVLVPEAATLLIQAGHRPGTREFQLAGVRIQLALEESCLSLTPQDRIMVCDRSIIDSLAYWLLLGGTEEEFYEATGMGYKDLYGRYDGAIQLQTAAIGALANYRRIAGGARMEDAEEAARIDGLCTQVWFRHPRFKLVENTCCEWPRKSREARQTLHAMVEQIRAEIERNPSIHAECHENKGMQ